MTIRPPLTDQNVVQEVKSFILDTILIGSYEESLQPQDSFLHKGILDSTGVLELVQFLEEHFGIKCNDEEITPENLDSLQAISSYVLRKLTQSSGTTGASN